MNGEPPNPPPEDQNVTASAPAPAAPSRRTASPAKAYGTPRPAGHGQRLTAAFEALERFPALEAARAALDELATWDAEAIEASLKAVVERLAVKPKDVYQPVRVALAGTTVSPGIFETVAVLGREETLRRIDATLAGG